MKWLFYTLLAFSAIFSFLYLWACLFLYLFQNSFLFYPEYTKSSQNMNQYSDIERLTIRATDGAILTGWKKTMPDANKTVMSFGGNAEDVRNTAIDWTVSRTNLITFEYRGYGESEGKPSEKNILSDALEIYDTSLEKWWFQSGSIFVLGRSLGSGVANYVASKRPVAGVILITPYDSILSVAKEQKLFSYFPISFLLKNTFFSGEWAKWVQVPVLIIFWAMDTTISPEHTRILQHWFPHPEKITTLEVPEGTHENILSFSVVHEVIEKFLQIH